MNNKIAIMGTLDTKSVECLYLQQKIQSMGCQTMLIDVSAGGGNQHPCDLRIEPIPATSRSEALTHIKQSACTAIKQLVADHEIDGIISLGGSGGTEIASFVMRALPLGFPKVLITTLGSSPSIADHVGGHDIIVLHAVADIAGVNAITRLIFDQGAGAVVGAIQARKQHQTESEKPKIAATMYGLTTPCVTVAKQYLEEHGFEVITFHANGSEGKVLEHLLSVGYFQGVLDITTTEVSAYVLGGDDSAGADRLKTAPLHNIPCVVCPGAMDLVYTATPDRYADHTLYAHNGKPSHFRPNATDNQSVGAYVAKQLNHAHGNCALLIPKQGLSAVDVAGGVLYDPIADQALFDAIEQNLDPQKVALRYHDYDINHPDFARLLAKTLLHLIKTQEDLR